MNDLKIVYTNDRTPRVSTAHDFFAVALNVSKEMAEAFVQHEKDDAEVRTFLSMVMQGGSPNVPQCILDKVKKNDNKSNTGEEVSESARKRGRPKGSTKEDQV